MTSVEAFVAAVEVAQELGWARATPEEALALPLGTAEQQRTMLRGLRSGELFDLGFGAEQAGLLPRDPEHYTDQSLVLLAIAVGVSGRRAVQLVNEVHKWDVPAVVLETLVGRRDDTFVRSLLKAAHRPGSLLRVGPFTHGPNPAIATAAARGIELPRERAVFERWVAYVDRFGEQAVPADTPFIDYLRLAVDLGVRSIDGTDRVLRAAAERDWAPRAELVALALDALDIATTTVTRRPLVAVLTGPLELGADDVATHAETMIGMLQTGDAAIIGAFAPLLIDSVPDDRLAEVLSSALYVRTLKAKRSVLTAASARPRPTGADSDELVQALMPATADADSRIADEARRVLHGWGFDAESAPVTIAAPVAGVWQAVPEPWTAPRFEATEGDIAHLGSTSRVTDGGAPEAETLWAERLIHAVNERAWADGEVAAACREWDADEVWAAAVHAGAAPTERGHVVLRPFIVLRREPRIARLVPTLGTVPELLSRPSRIDLLVDPDELVDRLRRYGHAGVAAIEADLVVAALRVDPGTVTEEHVRALADTRVPVVRRDGPEHMDAGAFLAAALADPLREPAMRLTPDAHDMEPAPLDVPAWLVPFTTHLSTWGRGYGFALHPHWGDAVGRSLDPNPSFKYSLGDHADEVALSRWPLTAGTAANLLAGLASERAETALQVEDAAVLAWARGLLVPGVADPALIGWNRQITGVSALAGALARLAERGPAAVVWGFLDALAGHVAAQVRVAPGTEAAVDAIANLLPEAEAAVAAGVARPDVLDLPGVRSLAARRGTSRAIAAAAALVRRLPEPSPAVGRGAIDVPGAAVDVDVDAAPGAADAVSAVPVPTVAAPGRAHARERRTPSLELETIWPRDAGTALVVDDGLPVVVVPDAEREGGVSVRVTIDEALAAGSDIEPGLYDATGWGGTLYRGALCLRALDASGKRLSVRAGEPAPVLSWDDVRGRPVLSRMGYVRPGIPVRSTFTRTMVVAIVVGAAARGEGLAHVAAYAHGSGLGAACVREVTRELLDAGLLDLTTLAKAVRREPTVLPALWPVLVEGVRAGASTEGPSAPTWLLAVLDTVRAFAPILRAAASTGRLPADAAVWPGLAELAARPGKRAAQVKARELRVSLGLAGEDRA